MDLPQKNLVKLSCISTVSPRLKLCIIYASFTHLKLWKPTYEQPSIQAKLQKLAKQHNSFDKLVQHDPLMQKLQKEIAQEGYKLTWKSKNILPAVPYEELAAYCLSMKIGAYHQNKKMVNAPAIQYFYNGLETSIAPLSQGRITGGFSKT
ncbi:hypothetical protein B9C88_12115 [Brevibacillus laterosporus]|uniref:hypothetical protein n=1 Tax=Brevibacillus laterosporus TaxID=1465 RepID=UPI000BD40B82|nr:hypothetical protein [Brevibacillus laterosporus]PCN44185.1 hypothetical protein B9C88_12115 [Brevibacillus laterosporus]